MRVSHETARCSNHDCCHLDRAIAAMHYHPNPFLTGLLYVSSIMAATGVADVPAHFGNAIMFDIAGVQVPLVTCGCAAICLILSRPLSKRNDPPLSRGKELLVTVILLMLAVAWVLESQPGLLFTMIVSFGLGYSGFSVMELMGDEILGIVKSFFSGIRQRIEKFMNREEK